MDLFLMTNEQLSTRVRGYLACSHNESGASACLIYGEPNSIIKKTGLDFGTFDASRGVKYEVSDTTGFLWDGGRNLLWTKPVQINLDKLQNQALF